MRSKRWRSIYDRNLCKFLILLFSLLDFAPLQIGMLLPSNIFAMSSVVKMRVETRKRVGRMNRRCWLRVVLLDSKGQCFQSIFRFHVELSLLFMMDL